jgi:hypothetical protein
LNTETINLIRELAAQLGTSADHLIALFVPRVIASAITWIFAGSATYPLCYTMIRKAHAIQDSCDRDLPIAFSWVFGVIACIFATVAIGTSIATLVSPEAAAILEIMSAIRGS